MIGPQASLPDGTPNLFSPAVRAGGLVFLSGLMPKGPDGQMIDGDIAVQTKAVMDRLHATLGEANCTFEDVVKCVTWLAHAEDFKSFNKIYASYFEGAPPARSAAQSDLLLPGARLELEAICYKPVAT
jgi:2-iminobutanoate/2-iminopropanoate deaminase